MRFQLWKRGMRIEASRTLGCHILRIKLHRVLESALASWMWQEGLVQDANSVDRTADTRRGRPRDGRSTSQTQIRALYSTSKVPQHI